MRAVRRYLNALIVLHRAFGHLPFGARVHALVRFATAPLLRVTAHIQPGSTVLDVGAGHGLFARLAIESGARDVVAVEPDGRKALAFARARQRTPEQFMRIRMVNGFDVAIRGSFDVVSVTDVLYAIPKAEWNAFLERMHERVAPGGVLLLKEMDPTSRLKNLWNRLQETITIRLLRLTLAAAIDFDEPPAMVERLRLAGFTRVEVVPVDRRYPHPHLLYVAHRPAQRPRPAGNCQC